MPSLIEKGRRNPGSQPAPDSLEQVSTYADLQSESPTLADIDWLAAEFDYIAEQTLGGNRLI